MASDGHRGPSSSSNVAVEGTEGSPTNRLCSGRSVKHAFVRFWNRTQSRTMRVLWVNYNGNYMDFSAIAPNQFLEVNTFENHPWVFMDADTGDKLLALGKEVFEPVAYNVEKGWPPQRTDVTIHVPVYSLQQRCLQFLRDAVCPDQLEKANVPLVLKEEIRKTLAVQRGVRQYYSDYRAQEDSAGADSV